MVNAVQNDDNVTATIPGDLLSRIDALLDGEFSNREDFMLAAARHYTEYMERQRGSDALEAEPASAVPETPSPAEPTARPNNTEEPFTDLRDPEVPNQAGHTVKPLAEDNDTPFSPPDSPVENTSSDLDTRTQEGQINPTHQATDTNMDPHEVYDEGLSGAAEAEEPNAGNAVADYNPPRKQDEDDDEADEDTT